MYNDNTTVLADIIAVAKMVKHPGARLHLRSAFVALSNSIVRETFGPLPSRNGEPMVEYNGAKQLATLRGITINNLVFKHIVDGNKLDAVKEQKTSTGKPLLECKQDVEDWGYAAGYYINPSTRSRNY